MERIRAVRPAILLATVCGLPFHPGAVAAQTCQDAALAPAASRCSSVVSSGLFLATADVNRDGRLDLVVAQGDGTVPVLLGNGDGTFQCPMAPFPAGPPSTPEALATGDLDGDGRADAVLASGPQVHVFPGTATGLAPPTAYPAGGGMSPKALATLDADGDGDFDIVASDPGAGSGTLRLLRNDGTGAFPSSSTLLTSQPADRMAGGDFDDDGHPDLVLLRSAGVAVALNDGVGGFLAPVSYPVTGTPVDVAVADLDRDGLLDVVVASNASPDLVVARLGSGTGALGPAIESAAIADNPEQILLGEYNGDGRPDVAVTHNLDPDLDLGLGAGDGSFVPGPALPVAGASASQGSAGDLDGDGLDDVALLAGGVAYVSINTTGDGCVRFVTARATGGDLPGTGVNDLEWLNPTAGPFVGIRIRFRPASSGACAAADYPATPGAGSPIGTPDTDFGGAGRMTFAHTGIDPGTTYCYSLFVNKDGSAFSPRQEISSRPFDSSSEVHWAFSTGASSLAGPGNGIGRVHANANNGVLFAMAKGPAGVSTGGGMWPAGFTPKAMSGPSQGRPSTLAFAAGSASRIVLAGSQDGHAYAVDADTGAQVWRSAELGAGVQAQPSGVFQAHGGSQDLVLVGSRSPEASNVFCALRAGDGTVAWKYNGADDTLRIGPINAQATVDYTRRRVYFTSQKRLPAAPDGPPGPDNRTVWALDVDTGDLVWSAAVGDVSQAPILRGSRLYVGSDDGQVHALDVDASGAEATGWPLIPGGGGEGRVKGYVAADRLTQDLYFSTTSKVWKYADSPTGPTYGWSRGGAGDLEIQSPSTPVYPPGGPVVYLGTGGPANGRIYRLRATDGGTQSSVPLGTTDAQVGSPTLDLSTSTLYAGTDGGLVYAISLP